MTFELDDELELAGELSEIDELPEIFEEMEAGLQARDAEVEGASEMLEDEEDAPDCCTSCGVYYFHHAALQVLHSQGRQRF